MGSMRGDRKEEGTSNTTTSFVSALVSLLLPAVLQLQIYKKITTVPCAQCEYPTPLPDYLHNHLKRM